MPYETMGTVLLIYLVALARTVASRELTPGTVVQMSRPFAIDTDREQLDLCDCRPAGGDPEGLSCDAEGYVVVGFERHGAYPGRCPRCPPARSSHSVSLIDSQVNGSSAEIPCR